jgi:hypothetical protein
MVTAMRQTLNEAGVDDDNIRPFRVQALACSENPA